MPHIYTRDEKVDMFIIYGECRKNAVAARNLHADRYPDRQCPARNNLNRLENQFRREPNHDSEENVIIDDGTVINVTAGIEVDKTVILPVDKTVDIPYNFRTLSAVSDGMQYGWTAPTIPILLSEEAPIDVSTYQAEWLESILMIGGCCGLAVTMYLVDNIGRKLSLIISATTTLLAWAVIAVAPRVEYIFVARFFAGMAGDMAFVAAPMYIAEIADQKIRGFLSSIIYIMMLIGILVLYCIAPFLPIWGPCVLAILINSIGLMIFSFQPESPYYLLYRNKPVEAEEALRRLRLKEDIQEEFQEISVAIERQKEERGRLLDLFLVSSNRKALIIMLMLNSSQHMSSISVMLMNLHSILEEAGSFYVATSTGAIIFSATMVCSAMSASFAIDNFGRKVLLCCSGVVAGISLMAIAVYFTLKNNGVNVLTASWLPLIMVMVYAASFKFGIGLVPIVLTAELFPAKVKAFGMTISNLSYVGFSVISLQVYHALRHAFGIQVPFYIFSCSCFCTVLFTIFYIPETKGKTLEEIQMILKGNSSPSDSESTK